MKAINKILLALAVVGSLTSLSADGADLYKKCIACHGVGAEKKALGKSAVIKGWKTSKTLKALKGYKAGTYGGVMKGVMKGQVAALNDAQIESVANYIQTIK